MALDETEADLGIIANAFEKMWDSEQVRDISEDVIEEMQRQYNETRSNEYQVITKHESKFEAIEFLFKVNKSFLSTKGLYVNKLHLFVCSAMFPLVWLTLASRRGEWQKFSHGKYPMHSGRRLNH